MNKSDDTTHPIRPRNSVDHMANERTFLAWIRTSIGLMAFGFVVERFALFTKQISLYLGTHQSEEPSIMYPGHSSIFGVILVIFGAFIGLLAFIKYKNDQKKIDDERYTPSSLPALLLTLSVVGMGIFLGIYLY